MLLWRNEIAKKYELMYVCLMEINREEFQLQMHQQYNTPYDDDDDDDAGQE